MKKYWFFFLFSFHLFAQSEKDNFRICLIDINEKNELVLKIGLYNDFRLGSLSIAGTFNDEKMIIDSLRSYRKMDVCYYPEEVDMLHREEGVDFSDLQKKVAEPLEQFSKKHLKLFIKNMSSWEIEKFYQFSTKEKMIILNGIEKYKLSIDFSSLARIYLTSLYQSEEPINLENYTYIKNELLSENERAILQKIIFLRRSIYNETIHYIELADSIFLEHEDQSLKKICKRYQIDEDGEFQEVTGVWWYISRYDVDFCFYQDHHSSLEDDLIYYLPGLTGGPETWSTMRAYREMRSFWRIDRGSLPNVISLTLGKTVFFNDEDIFLLFSEKVIPFLERSLGLRPKRRMALGASMGGGNLVYTLLKKPDLFSKMGIICPSIWATSPFAEQEEIERYVKESGGGSYFIQLAFLFLRFKFWSEDEFLRKSILRELEEKGLEKGGPEVYLSIGHSDELGLRLGAEKLYDILVNEGVQTEFHIRDGEKGYFFMNRGGHCLFNSRELSLFFK